MGELHPEIKKHIRKFNFIRLLGVDMSLLSLRKYEDKLLPPEEKRPVVAKIEDRDIPGPGGGIPVKIITPDSKGPLPVIAFFHGGGFCSGSYGEILARSLARDVPAVVVSVNYRLSPEHKFPEPLEDCYAAAEWVHSHSAELGGGSPQVVVAGDSAGGNLSIAVSMLAREKGTFPVSGMLLMYPMTDYHSPSDRSPYESVRRMGKKYLLTMKHVFEAQNHYMRNTEDRENAYIFPMKAESLSGLPPALILTAEFDPLRDEGEAFGERLGRENVPAEVIRCEGMIHAFMEQTDFDIVKKAYRKASEFVNACAGNRKAEGKIAGL